MSLSQISLYQPAWTDDAGVRRLGWDEDEMTASVEALSGVAATSATDHRILTVVTEPGGEPLELAPLPSFLGLRDAYPLDVRVGGAATVLECLADSPADRVVVATEQRHGAHSAAALLDADNQHGVRVDVSVRSSRAALPAVGDSFIHRTQVLDSRLVRDSVLAPVLTDLLRDVTGTVAIVGVPTTLSTSIVERLPLRSQVRLAHCVSGGASQTLAALTELASDGDGDATVIGFDPSGRAVKAAVTMGELAVAHVGGGQTSKTSLIRVPDHQDGGALPLNSAGYVRSYRDKAVLMATRCHACAAEYFPPRRFCSACLGDDLREFALARSGEIVSSVTRHVPIPGLPHPMGIAVVKLDRSAISVMVHVTDGNPDRATIGRRGTLRLRRIATRAGIPDYALAFSPDEDATTEAA